MNPLYYAKRQVTDFYAQASTSTEPVMTLQPQDLTIGENPLHDFTATTSNKRYVDNKIEGDIFLYEIPLYKIGEILGSF